VVPQSVVLVWVADDLVAFQLGVQVSAAYDQAVVDALVDSNLVPNTTGHSNPNYNKQIR